MAGNPIERTKGIAGRYALSMLKRPKLATGGVVGPLLSYEGGRTDSLPINVPQGSYVIPSDVVSGLPGAQGSSLAGHLALEKLMQQLPLSPDEVPYGASAPDLPKGRTIPGLFNQKHLIDKALAKGGKAGEKDDEGGTVPILAAGGEHIISPKMVKRIGLGNLKRGHAVLDAFVLEVRKRNIKDLKALPPPAKS